MEFEHNLRLDKDKDRDVGEDIRHNEEVQEGIGDKELFEGDNIYKFGFGGDRGEERVHNRLSECEYKEREFAVVVCGGTEDVAHYQQAGRSVQF
jgi:hypothetical protein